MLLTSWIWATAAVAEASPNTSRIHAIEEAWAKVESYCSDFVLGFHSESGSALSKGERCWERSGRIRTATQTQQGVIVEIRADHELWYSNPSEPTVLHVTAAQDLDNFSQKIGRGIGELVELVTRSPAPVDMGSVRLNGQETWRFGLPRPDGSQAIVFVNAESHLPVALELRNNNRAIVSYGLLNLTLDPLLPEDFFRIEPATTQRLVEVTLDPNDPHSEEALRTLRDWRRP